MQPTTISNLAEASLTPERFIVDVRSEIDRETIQERWRDVNALLRLSMLAGVPMQLEGALNLLCDIASEIVDYDSALVYFWEESEEQVSLRGARGLDPKIPEALQLGNVLNLWATKYSRPLSVELKADSQSDSLLESLNAKSALTIPLIINNRAMGSLQLFSENEKAFSRSDAQLLWIMALIAESVLTREYNNEGLLTFAFTDYLTGLKTRGFFEQQLDLEIKRSERKGTRFSLLMIDIDFFKQINDRHGHHVGDCILRDVASLLSRDMREVDTVARYGGEEFVIILPETGESGAAKVAERLRKMVDGAKFYVGTESAIDNVTISLGVSVYDSDARFKRDLIELADGALYEAKSRGRNRVVLHSQIAANRKQVS